MSADPFTSPVSVLPALTPADPKRLSSFSTPVSWMVRDPERFLALMKEAGTLVEGGLHFSDNLFTFGRNNSMFDDQAFRKAWESNCVNDADRAIVWRRYILATLAHHAVQLDGDFAECGVYAGTGIKTVMDYLGGPAFPKAFWAYDTFDYNPVEGHAFEGQEVGFHDKVTARFAGYANVKLVKGLIPDTFAQAMPERLAYLHIDLNHAAAEIAVLDHLFERVVPGGVVIFDDYEWAGVYRTQKIAEDAWLDARGYRVTALPTGQGMVIKR
ncbi:MAG: class I SAM-dependent methyltransferase [Betaproteobacteria bacterium]|nr:class I SAM-dependent methyltransferase [Betaproteobacteria bacterium]